VSAGAPRRRRARPGALALAALAVSLLAWACVEPPEQVALPWEALPFPVVAEPPDNPGTADKVALGELLFYDPVLSADGLTACATCHSEVWGMSDGLPLAIGVGAGPLAGPGRVGPALGERNSQTLWNVALREELFWDGRVVGLEAQALLPLHSDVELARDPAEALAALRAIPEYVSRFAAAFPDAAEPISEATLAKALAAFQRTLVSDRALYDAYVDGDARALDDAMARGLWRFAEAGCDGCHAPPTFEGPGYAPRGVASGDPGRAAVSGDPADHGAFRVPTLRNVRDSGPYFHDGSVAELRDAVRHELRLSPLGGTFDESDVEDITAFIGKALLDRTRDPYRPLAVPSGLPVPLDGFRIPR